MKVAIVGSRSFIDYEALKKFILGIMKVEDIELIVSGGATGADKLGERFAKEFRIPTKIFIPDWNGLGKKAGFVRNIDIVKASDVVFAFWDGTSRGTQHTMSIASELDKKLHVFLTR